MNAPVSTTANSADVSPGAVQEPGAGQRIDWRKQLDRLAAFLPWRRRYEHRQGRSGYISETLRGHIVGQILEVGAGRNAAVFKQVFGDFYHPLDMGGSYHIEGRPDLVGPDTIIDLEHEPLPFPDRSFDTILCTDVLEHIDNIYHAYDELFRVANRKVIISLPNNWVGFGMSLLAGRNITHTNGYGLPPLPKGVGERHKHWFNHEEAADFLINRIPQGFRVERYDPVFEYGLDSLLTGIRPFLLLVRSIEMGNFFKHVRRDYPGAKGMLLSVFGPLVYVVLRPIDVVLSGLIWGFGRAPRFYNLFCRQVWVVFERIGD
jgi:hypothetical protein